MDEPKVKPAERSNRTTLWLVAGFGLLLLLVLIFAARSGGNPDRLDDTAAAGLPEVEENSAECSSNAIVNALKRGLFEAAAQGRPADAEAFRQVASAAVARMENAALESEAGERLDCSGSLAIDLPPGIVGSGGRRHLLGNVDYSVERGGGAVNIRNAASLVNALAALSRSSNGVTSPINAAPSDTSPDQPIPLDDQPGALPDEPAEPGLESAPPPRAAANPSFNCANARTRGEHAVCSDPGLAALDRQMASQYQRAMSTTPPEAQALLRRTRDRFLAYRDRCSSDACIAGAYQDRMREISDIAAGRWQPPR